MSALHDLKSELKALGIGLIALTAVIWFAFPESATMQVVRTAASLYWIFVIPGYALSLCSKQPFVDRLIIGIAVQTAAYGLASYYLGLAGWHVATHGLVLPAVSIVVGVILWKKLRD